MVALGLFLLINVSFESREAILSSLDGFEFDTKEVLGSFSTVGRMSLLAI